MPNHFWRYGGAFALLVCFLVDPSWAQVELVAPTEPLSAEEQQTKFHLPPGFEIQLVAAEPDIRKPINLGFDRQGRLYATQSEEYPFPVETGTAGRDVVKIFDDFDEHGSARRVSTYVDGLNIPIGVLPIEGGVLVYSIPNIYFCPDADGDDRADSRDVLYGTFGVVDTHGMGNSFRQWIDGWIYGCHGFANQSELSGSDQQTVSMHSGNTYRMRPDGSHIEQWTWGQVNPFGLAFDPLGNLYSSDCHTLPIYMLLRGAYYPSFGKPHDGLGFGPTMLDHLHGSTGIAGIAYYAADHFPAEYRDTIFVGNPVTGRVNHDALEPHGSTFRAIERPDFVRCDDPWFRPVDVQLGPDGALYIADFYNRIIGHYEVPLTHPGRDRERGRIWRVVYTGLDGSARPPQPMPNLSQQNPATLVDLLANANLVVRTLVTHELAARWSEADLQAPLQALLTSTGDPARRTHALWLLERFGPLDDETVQRLLRDDERMVRVHMVKALAERPDWNATSLDVGALIREKLSDDDPFVRRAAADALGRHPAVENLSALLAVWHDAPSDDTHLIHTARIALRDQLLEPDMYDHASSLAASSADSAARLADVSLGARSAESASFILQRLKTASCDPNRLPDFVRHVARYLTEAELPALAEFVVSLNDIELSQQFSLAQALHQASQERQTAFDARVATWCERLCDELMAQEDAQRVREGIELARDLRIAEVHERLLGFAAAGSSFASLRPVAIDAAVAVDAAGTLPLLADTLGANAEPMELRQKIASTLGAVNSDESRGILIERLPTAPERLAIEIAAALAGSPQGGEQLLSAIERGAASPRLLQDRNVEGRLRVQKLSQFDERLRQLTAALPTADERIAELIAQRLQGFSTQSPNLTAGEAIFRKTCAACHRLAGQGAKIGPELDGVGQRGLERVLEDVLDPSRNVDQAFRTTLVTTTDGRVVSGLVLREEGNVLVLADSQGKEVRVPLDEIDERAESMLSPMPANVPDLVSEIEFYHLMGYLLAQRQAAESAP